MWLTFLSFDSSSRHDVIGQVVLPLTDLSLSQDNVFRTDIRPSLKVCMGLHFKKMAEKGIILDTEFPPNCLLKTVLLVCYVKYPLPELDEGINGTSLILAGKKLNPPLLTVR